MPRPFQALAFAATRRCLGRRASVHARVTSQRHGPRVDLPSSSEGSRESFEGKRLLGAHLIVPRCGSADLATMAGDVAVDRSRFQTLKMV